MKRSLVLTTILLTAFAFCATAQSEDSLRISRSRAEADSILRVITGRAPRPASASQPSTPATPAAQPAPVIPATDGLSRSVADTPRAAPIQTQPATPAAPQGVRAGYQRPAGTVPAGTAPGAPQGQTPGAAAPSGRPQGQYPGAAGAGAPAAGGYSGMKMSIGHVYGKVIDAQKKPVGYAAVSLLNMKDSLITGQLTEDNGEFSLTELPFGAYNLKITFIGYKDIVQKVVITPNKMDQDVGNLVMAADATKLKEVDVTATRSNMELKVDRKVFNVGSDLSVRGGTALDAMKNIPSVSTDASGNVTLRNNTPQIYVDGKPTTLTLEQIPADQIDKIEVITNPSAKFEAASSGGIINVVMKRNAKPGYNGIVNANIATNYGYNGMAMFNLREKKFGVQVMYTVNGNTNRTKGVNNTTYLDAFNNPSDHIDQDINSVNKRLFQVARVGLDFYINNRNTLSISENGVFGNFENSDDINITRDLAGALTNGSQINTQNNHFRNFTTDLNFKHTYPKEGKEYTLDIQYNRSSGAGNYLYTTNSFLPNGSIVPSFPAHQYTAGSQTADMITAQWDISLPIRTNMKIETGLRSNYKLTHTNNKVNNDTSLADGSLSAQWFNLPLSNNYRIDDLVNAAYITFSHQVKNFSYQLGLRAEQVYYKGTSQLNGDSSFSYQYPSDAKSITKMLFPSLNISQKWGTKHELQFNVARKVNRPNFFQIAPFIFSSNATTVQRGNPSLQPEFINQGELNYNLTETKVNWLSSLYGRYVQQPITTVIYPLAGTDNVFVNTFANGSYSMTGGWENTLKIYPVKKLDITLTGNVFYTQISGTAGTASLTNSGFSWLAKGMVSYKFPLDFAAQINGTYEAPRILPQGKTTPLYFFDLSLSKDFMGFITLSFTVSDVLNSRTNGTNVYQASALEGTGYVPGFSQHSTRRRDQRFARLGVSFRFGKMDASFFKKKRPSGQQGGGEDMGF